jgi:uncharacterized membrane protein YeaQ/YmgE (transglycosylase-associated protein family)
MGIIAWVVFGFIVGLIARAVLPGNQKMGWVMTTVLGIAGSLVGGAVGNLFTHHQITDTAGAGFIGSIIGAIVLMVVVGLVTGGRRRAVV